MSAARRNRHRPTREQIGLLVAPADYLRSKISRKGENDAYSRVVLSRSCRSKRGRRHLLALGRANRRARDGLAAHKLHVAEHYVPKAGMQDQTAQITKTIDSVGDRVDGVNQRFDRLYGPKPARRSS